MSHRMLDPRSDLQLALSDQEIARLRGRDFRCAFSEVFAEDLDTAGVAPRARFVGRPISATSASLRPVQGDDVTVAVGDTIATIEVAPGVYRGPYTVSVIEPLGGGLVALRLEESS